MGVPATCTDIVRRLEEVAGLDEGWDGYGADRISPRAILSAHDFLSYHLPDDYPAPAVVPMTGGRVQLEWHRGKRSLELEFGPDATVHYLKWPGKITEAEEEVVGLDDRETLSGLLGWFISPDPSRV
jgi:hypothetical protein